MLAGIKAIKYAVIGRFYSFRGRSFRKKTSVGALVVAEGVMLEIGGLGIGGLGDDWFERLENWKAHEW